MPVTIGSTVAVEWVPSWDAAGHSATLTVTKPDGTTTSPTVSAGVAPVAFTADVLADQAGRYTLRWEDTTLDAVGTDIFDVWPEDPRFLISIEDAAEAIRWPAKDKNKNLDLLRLYVAAATEVIEDIVGAVLIRTVVQPSDGGRTGVALWERPSSITGVNVNGSAATGYIPNLNAGIVYADGHGGRFPDGIQNIVVTYQTGAAAVPTSIQLAARELIRHLWNIGQQAADGGTPTYSSTGEVEQTLTGFAVPRRVIELCVNTHRLPGMA